MAIAIGATLSRSPLVVVGSNSVPFHADVEIERGNTSACQPTGTIPQGTTAIREALEVRAVGPRVALEVRSGSHVVTNGVETAGWGVATSATVPVRRVSHTIRGGLLCTTIGPTVEPFRVHGALVSRSGGRVLRNVKLIAEYLRPGPRSWWSLASRIAYRMGLGRAPSGTWIVFLAIALMLVVTTFVSRLVLRELTADGGRLGRLPRAALICALIACINAACWSLITPPFQVPDEPSHFAYTQHLAEHLEIPTSSEATYSPEEQAVLAALHHAEVRGSPETHTIATAEQQLLLTQTMSQHLSRVGVGAGGAVSDPPLYYLLQTVPYELASAGTLLDQLELMRLASALLAAITAFFAFMFVREALPGVRWAWTVGGLGVALAPVLGFMSGADNPDSMLFAVSAAILYCLARGFRRGLTRRLALVLGALTATGLITKLNFVGLTPGIVLALVVLSIRVARASGRRAAAVSLALALAIPAIPACIYVLANLASGRPPLGVMSTMLQIGSGHRSLLTDASYAWQLFLPRLPGMHDDFPGLFTARDLWFNRSVGFYGWLDTTFPAWVDTIALIAVGLIALLCVRSLAIARARLHTRVLELMLYAVMGVGLMAVIGASSYFDSGSEGVSFAEPRYLAPLLPLLGATLALGARGAGRRWGPTVGAVLVVLVLAHDVFSQLLVVARFYG
jgi:hypothetical protein